ncbi:MAG: hypothetical protein AVO35_06820 [Candidatus Aegiribacteria sp. MLS_C]|nr:MAG: hypothetical protein AVO35_06820 [Candidatus Aegiribacteria sp. MLS_C]
MGARFELEPGENVLADTRRHGLQGKRIKFPVITRCVLTDRRFVFFDLGRMAPFYMQLGFLLRPLVKGAPVSLPLDGMRVSRGVYFRNRNLLELESQNGSSVLLDRFEKSLEWLREILHNSGYGLTPTGGEEWMVAL